MATKTTAMKNYLSEVQVIISHSSDVLFAFTSFFTDDFCVALDAEIAADG
jgi:hypothetical protein